MQSLTKAEEAELRFLRNEVDKYVVEEGRLDRHPNVKNDLARARRELKEYVKNLQKAGRHIYC